MSLPRDLVRILTIRCEEASSLTSRELDEPLGRAETLALRGHTLVCRSCRRLRRQLQFLQDAIRRRAAEPDGDGAGRDGLSPEARDRIGAAIMAGFGRGRGPRTARMRPRRPAPGVCTAPHFPSPSRNWRRKRASTAWR